MTKTAKTTESVIDGLNLLGFVRVERAPSRIATAKVGKPIEAPTKTSPSNRTVTAKVGKPTTPR